MPRFVILEHDHPVRHWDFMLEAGEVLRTWRLDVPPESGRTIRAVPSFDHRLAYLDYQGAVSGGRGSVTRWDSGNFSWVKASAEQVAVRLDGGRLRGMAELTRITEEQWSLQWTALAAC